MQISLALGCSVQINYLVFLQEKLPQLVTYHLSFFTLPSLFPFVKVGRKITLFICSHAV